jgi:hypothetical protein
MTDQTRPGSVYCLPCWNANVTWTPHTCAGPTIVAGRTYRCPCECQDTE